MEDHFHFKVSTEGDSDDEEFAIETEKHVTAPAKEIDWESRNALDEGSLVEINDDVYFLWLDSSTNFLCWCMGREKSLSEGNNWVNLVFDVKAVVYKEDDDESSSLSFSFFDAFSSSSYFSGSNEIAKKYMEVKVYGRRGVQFLGKLIDQIAEVLEEGNKMCTRRLTFDGRYKVIENKAISSALASPYAAFYQRQVGDKGTKQRQLNFLDEDGAESGDHACAAGAVHEKSRRAANPSQLTDGATFTESSATGEVAKGAIGAEVAQADKKLVAAETEASVSRAIDRSGRLRGFIRLLSGRGLSGDVVPQALQQYSLAPNKSRVGAAIVSLGAAALRSSTTAWLKSKPQQRFIWIDVESDSLCWCKGYVKNYSALKTLPIKSCVEFVELIYGSRMGFGRSDDQKSPIGFKLVCFDFTRRVLSSAGVLSLFNFSGGAAHMDNHRVNGGSDHNTAGKTLYSDSDGSNSECSDDAVFGSPKAKSAEKNKGKSSSRSWWSLKKGDKETPPDDATGAAGENSDRDGNPVESSGRKSHSRASGGVMLEFYLMGDDRSILVETFSSYISELIDEKF